MLPSVIESPALLSASDPCDFSAFVPPDLGFGVKEGRPWRRTIEGVRAAAVAPIGITILDARGGIWRHGPSVERLWGLPKMPGAGPCAVSSDGKWVFDGTTIQSRTGVMEPFRIDGFERWTFARFLDDRHLALAFESGPGRSKSGDRYGGIQVQGAGESPAWALTAFEFESRSKDESFVPRDVVWHPRGVLAWLTEESLRAQVRSTPRVAEVTPRGVPPRDSDGGELTVDLDRPGHWRSLSLAPEGRRVAVLGTDEIQILDLKSESVAHVPLLAHAMDLAKDRLVALTATEEREDVALRLLDWQRNAG